MDVVGIDADLPGRPDQSPPPPARRRLRNYEIYAAVCTVLALCAVGAGLASVWSAVSPKVSVVATADGPTIQPGGGEEFFAGDGMFLLLGLIAGMLTGAVLWYAASRWRGPVLLVGLAVGGVLSSLVAWQLGRHIGLAEYQELLSGADAGRRFDRPVDVRAHGVLLAQPISAVATYVVLAGWAARRASSAPAVREAAPGEPAPRAAAGTSSPPA